MKKYYLIIFTTVVILNDEISHYRYIIENVGTIV